jgi:8-oxo-dGTP diphosphatase
MCTPSLAIDAIIEYEDPSNPGEVSLVLVKRGKEPKGFAIPGGFVDVGESVEDATIREVMEETNLELSHLSQFRMYSNPTRDKRRHTASMVFRCIAK